MKTAFVAFSLLVFTATAAAALPKSPTTRPAARPYMGVKPILLTVPEHLYPAPKKQWTRIKAELANEALKPSIGRQAVFTFNVRDVGRGEMPSDSADEQDTCWLTSDEVPCDTWKIAVICYFHDGEKAALADINVDDRVKVEGRISRCEFSSDAHRGWVLSIDLADSRLVADPAEHRARTRR